MHGISHDAIEICALSGKKYLFSNLDLPVKYTHFTTRGARASRTADNTLCHKIYKELFIINTGKGKVQN